MTDYLQLSFGSYGGAAAAAIWLLLRRRPIEQHLLHIKLLSSALCVLELKRARVRSRVSAQSAGAGLNGRPVGRGQRACRARFRIARHGTHELGVS